MQVHEREPRTKVSVERDRRLDRAAPRGDERAPAVAQPVARAVLRRDAERLAARC